MIRAYQVRGIPDEISECVGSQHYVQHWYPKPLKEAVLGPHSVEHVRLTRYYPNTTPPVVVDFEPSPLEGKFYLDEKRKFCVEQGIAYVPIFMGERLTKEQFRERLKHEIRMAIDGHQSIIENQALNDAIFQDLEVLLQDDRVLKRIDEVALARAHEWQKQTGKKGFVVGKIVLREKKKIVTDIRARAKNGQLGRYLSAHQLSGAIS